MKKYKINININRDIKIKKENIPKNIGRKYIIFLILFYNMQII